jgi:hypothetical protein
VVEGAEGKVHYTTTDGTKITSQAQARDLERYTHTHKLTHDTHTQKHTHAHTHTHTHTHTCARAHTHTQVSKAEMVSKMKSKAQVDARAWKSRELPYRMCSLTLYRQRLKRKCLKSISFLFFYGKGELLLSKVLFFFVLFL